MCSLKNLRNIESICIGRMVVYRLPKHSEKKLNVNSFKIRKVILSFKKQQTMLIQNIVRKRYCIFEGRLMYAYTFMFVVLLCFASR